MKTLLMLPIALGLGLLISHWSANGQAGELGLPAQTAPFKEFEQHGNLFDLKIVPAGKETRLYLVGKETASVKFENTSVVGKLNIGDNEKVIVFHKGKDFFTTQDVLHGHTLHIKAKDENTQKSEEFHVDLKKNNP